jgi:hypothetical protein
VGTGADRLLAAMSADAFEAMLRRWEAAIDEAARKG